MNRPRNTKRSKKSQKGEESPYNRNLETLNVRTVETTSTRRSRRKRMAIFGFKVTVVVLGVVMSAVMIRHAFVRAFVESEHFTLNRFEIQTNGRLERAQVQAATGVREGANLLKLDLVKIEADARALPQVESAMVERILPDGLRIVFRERVPIAWVSCLPDGWRPRSATNGMLVDREGKLFRCESLTPDLLGLPVLDLRESLGLRSGQSLPAGAGFDALALLDKLAGSYNPNAPELRQLSVRNGYTLEASLASGETAWLSPDELIADFDRLSVIIDDFRRRGQNLEFVNLLPKKNIAVRLAAPKPESAAPLAEATAAAPAQGASKVASAAPRKSESKTEKTKSAVASRTAKNASTVKKSATAPVKTKKTQDISNGTKPVGKSRHDPELRAILNRR